MQHSLEGVDHSQLCSDFLAETWTKDWRRMSSRATFGPVSLFAILKAGAWGGRWELESSVLRSLLISVGALNSCCQLLAFSLILFKVLSFLYFFFQVFSSYLYY